MKRLLLLCLLALPLAAENITLILLHSPALLARIRDAQEVGKTPDGVEFGEPAIERAGVANRRMAFSHEWDRQDQDDLRGWRWIKAKLEARGIQYQVRLQGGLPDNWRYPVQP
jgi:hypothetical protein